MIRVTKRDGRVEEFDVDKLNHWAIWAAENSGISWTDVVFGAVSKMYDGVTSQELQKALIDTCIQFRTEEHTKVAARLLVGNIYKEAFDDFSIPSLSDFYHHMVEGGYWIDMGFSEEELDFLDGKIDHTKDFSYAYATLRQFIDKYSLKADGHVLESPQMMMMGLAMSNSRYNGEERLADIIEQYEEISGLRINLPTPTLSMERSASLPAPSCCVISGSDTVPSIGAATHVAYDMTAKSAGIGFELTTRAPKDPVKGGRIEHGGKYAYYSYVDRAVKANKQVVRGGSATVTYNVLDPEVDELLTMRSQRTDSTYRLDQLDFSLAFNSLFLKKAAKNEEWMSVSVINAPELWRLSYAADPVAFEAEYDRVLASNIKKRVRPARDLFKIWVTNRGDNGRIYATFLDNVNGHTPFIDEIRLSNLCQEICIPTKGFDDVGELYKTTDSVNGEVGLCNLASIVVSKIKSLDDYIQTAYVTAKTIDNCIEHGVYPFPHIEHTAKARRSIGVGITDLAHLMAREGYSYDSEAGRNFMHRLAEMHSFALHVASVRLAKERGRCEWFHKTKYANDTPWLPIDDYAKGIDEYHTQELLCDWEWLRGEIKKHGVRFSVHEAFMPVESSSVFTNSTNGLYPIRKYEIYKSSPKGLVYFRCPGMGEYKYQNAFEISDLDLVSVYGIFQKFGGQGISSDFYTKLDGVDEKLSLRGMLMRMLKASKCGMKTMYYENFATAEEIEKGVEVPTNIEGVDCEDCKM